MIKCKNKDLTPLLGFLLRAIQQAPSADNSQPWHCFWDGKVLFLVYDSNRAGNGVFGPESQATLLAIGGVIEHIKQAAKSINILLSIDLTPTTFRGEHCYCQITVDEKVELPPGIDSNDFAFLNRHTNRLGFKSGSISKDIIEKVSGESEQQAKAAIFNDRKQIMQIAGLVFNASKVRFQTKTLHEWLSGSLRFGDEGEIVGDGLDINTIDLPPGGKAFMRFIRPWKVMSFLNSFGVYWVMAKIDSMPVAQAPVVVAVTSPSTYIGAIEAGQLISRIWIDLNEKGIAVHPYYVISDQLQRYEGDLVADDLVRTVDSLVKETKTFFGLNDGETLQILLRIGYPKKQPVCSKRLPMEMIFTDVSTE